MEVAIKAHCSYTVKLWESTSTLRIDYVIWLEWEFTNSKNVFKNGYEYSYLNGV